MSVAMRTFGVWEPETMSRFDAAVWYPANTKSKYVEREGWLVITGASRSPKIIPGQYPVILISHDTASSRFANNDIAASLAQHGFIVVASSHTGDNTFDSSKIYSAELFFQRPRNILQSLQTLLATPDLAPYVDDSRIGLIGIGFGAITVAQLSGIAPQPDLLMEFCSQKKNLEDTFCSSWSGELMSNLTEDTDEILKRLGPAAFTPAMDYYPILENLPIVDAIEKAKEEKDEGKKEKNPKKIKPETNATETTKKGRLDFLDNIDPLFLYNKAKLATERDQTDGFSQRKPKRHSIKSVAFISPAGGMLFPAESTVGIIPSLLIVSRKNKLYPYEGHAKPYIDLFPALPHELILDDADHFSFFAPCKDDMALVLHESCQRFDDPKRTEIALKRDKALAKFFIQTLGAPLPPAPTPETDTNIKIDSSPE